MKTEKNVHCTFHKRRKIAHYGINFRSTNGQLAVGKDTQTVNLMIDKNNRFNLYLYAYTS